MKQSLRQKNDDNSETVYEIADLIYHLTVMMVKLGIPLEDVLAELEKKKRKRQETLKSSMLLTKIHN